MKSQFKIKDSGKRQRFDGGAVRDTEDDKPRFDLIPPLAELRLAIHYAKGAKKYDEWNWSLGMPYSRFLASLKRHLAAFERGETDEDHLAALVFNAMSLMHFQECGRDDLDDITPRTKQWHTDTCRNTCRKFWKTIYDEMTKQDPGPEVLDSEPQKECRGGGLKKNRKL